MTFYRDKHRAQPICFLIHLAHGSYPSDLGSEKKLKNSRQSNNVAARSTLYSKSCRIPNGSSPLSSPTSRHSLRQRTRNTCFREAATGNGKAGGSCRTVRARPLVSRHRHCETQRFQITAKNTAKLEHCDSSLLLRLPSRALVLKRTPANLDLHALHHSRAFALQETQ